MSDCWNCGLPMFDGLAASVPPGPVTVTVRAHDGSTTEYHGDARIVLAQELGRTSTVIQWVGPLNKRELAAAAAPDLGSAAPAGGEG